MKINVDYDKRRQIRPQKEIYLQQFQQNHSQGDALSEAGMTRLQENDD